METNMKKTSNLEGTKHHIVDFFNWFNNVQKKFAVISTRKEKNELLFLLLQLKKQLTHSITLLNLPSVAERQEFICEICSGKIVLEPLQDIWECLESHSHLKPFVNVQSLEEPIQIKKELPKSSPLICHPQELSNKEASVDEKIEFKEKSDKVISKECNVDLKQKNHSSGDLKNFIDFDKVKLSADSINKSTGDLNLSSNSCVFDKKGDAESPVVKSRPWYPLNFLRKVDKSVEDSEVKPQASKSSEDRGKNTFRFNFKNKYSPSLEALLYPKLYHRFDIDDDPILQKTGPDRTVCLTCSCELLNQKAPSNIMSHMSGTQHVNKAEKPKTQLIIKNYHDTFLSLERDYQSHQIYFATDKDSFYLRCVICIKYVRCSEVLEHIMDNTHITKLIHMSIDNKMHSLFYFLESHLEVYGVFRPVSKSLNAPDQKEKPKNTNVKQHNIVKSIEKPNTTSKLNLPVRFSQHLKYLQCVGDLVFCTICENNIFKHEDTCLHLVQPTHIVKSKIQMGNYQYHCEVCDKRMHDEIAWIIHFEEEKKSHQEAESKTKDKPLEYECLTCEVVLFGDSEAVQKHRQRDPPRRNDKTKAILLNKEVKQYFSSKTVIRENGKMLLDDAESVIANTDIVIKCLDDLENALKSKYSSCKAYPFGSRVSGLGGSHSDLDIFIDIGSMYQGNQNQDTDNQTKIITTVMNLIQKKKEFYHINCIPTARTPIIQLKHRPTALECDISFVHGLSVENTKFIRYCFEMQPIAQKLILLVKKWSHLCGLSENISTYALAMLGIFYLQKNNYLLSVQKLKELNRRNVTIVGWETIDYVTPKEEIIKHIDVFNGDIIELLIGFFNFYSDFNYKLNIVCPLLGTEISKGLFSIDLKGSALPKEMASYFIKVNTEKSPEYFRCLSSFCIQDPFDLSHNLTKACSGAFLDKFVKLCTLTYLTLSNLKD